MEAGQLERFEAVAHELGMTVLLELHNASELEKCRNMTTPLWGVNNRNLRTFEVTLQQTLDLLPELNGKTVVTESGIRNKEDVDFMRGHGVHTFLIGETFMRAEDIEAEVKKTVLNPKNIRPSEFSDGLNPLETRKNVYRTAHLRLSTRF